tara:strand:- start:27206 stop:29092 length:1887 start_codon:yes stop_codon:yes gene_type:complete
MSKKGLMLGGAVRGAVNVADVFSTYLNKPVSDFTDYTISNGINTADNDAMIWGKSRSATGNHYIYDTVRGSSSGNAKSLSSNSTNAETAANTDFIKTRNSDGFEVGFAAGGGALTNSGIDYVFHTFRKATKFFDVQTAAHTNGVATIVDLSSLDAVGMVEVKSTIGTSNWFTWHRSLTAGSLVYLNLTNAETVDSTISVSGTSLTISSSAPTDTYAVYAYAHDTDPDEGMIQCSSFTTDGSGNADVTLGWEPQYVICKKTDTTGGWEMIDSMRGCSVGGVDSLLQANTSAAEVSSSYCDFNSTGFSITNEFSNRPLIYLAIRAPMMVEPESADEVFAIDTFGSTGDGKAPAYRSPFPVDFSLSKSVPNVDSNWVSSRLTGTNRLKTDSTAAQAVNASAVYDYMNGWLGVTTTDANSQSWMWKRAKGFMSIFADTGTGANKLESHDLGAVPELWLRKGRSGTTQWVWGSSLVANTEKINMPTVAGKVTDATAWNSTYPTSTQFSIGTSSDVNTNTVTYITYLFASLAGISKIDTYTGDNSAGKIINCGFSAGAKFVIIISLSSTRDIFFWDTTRGIVAGNSPHLSLNTTAAQVTTDDSIDPAAAGFAINQDAATNINVTGESYLYYAIA